MPRESTRAEVRPLAAARREPARISSVITRDIRRYMSRDWQALRDAKDRYWAVRISELGAGEGLRIADELRRQALRQNPGWPSSDDRRDDLATHLRLAELLRRARRSGRR